LADDPFLFVLRLQGIEVLERIPIPPEMIPLDAHVEIDAKVAVGYHGGSVFNKLDTEGLKQTKGRDYGAWWLVHVCVFAGQSVAVTRILPCGRWF
jgi:hypothetical protein